MTIIFDYKQWCLQGFSRMMQPSIWNQLLDQQADRIYYYY